MKQYICTVCGYIHETEGELPDDFKCPLCGAGKDAFVLKEETAKAEETLEKPHTEKELSPMEMSIICSNLVRGCEKQYMPEESESFRKLAEFFHQKAEPHTQSPFPRQRKIARQSRRRFQIKAPSAIFYMSYTL